MVGASLPIKEKPPILLVDASIYIFQYYFSLPDHWFSEKEQWPTAAVYGYGAWLGRVLERERPSRMAVCFDESLEQCFRNEIYPGYKASRALPDEALAFQLQACRHLTELLGIRCFASPRYEADDLLGSLYHQCRRSRTSIALLSRDKDLGQLLARPQDYLWDYAAYEKALKKVKDPGDRENEGRFYSPDIEQKFGVKPEQMIDYLALVGDSIDDIPGVPGIGKKTAQQLLAHFGDIGSLFEGIDSLEAIGLRGAKRVRSSLIEYQEQIAVAQQLAAIVTDLKLIQGVGDLALAPVNTQALQAFCQDMGFARLYARLTAAS